MNSRRIAQELTKIAKELVSSRIEMEYMIFGTSIMLSYKIDVGGGDAASMLRAATPVLNLAKTGGKSLQRTSYNLQNSPITNMTVESFSNTPYFEAVGGTIVARTSVELEFNVANTVDLKSAHKLIRGWLDEGGYREFR